MSFYNIRHTYEAVEPHRTRFMPYSNNGGSVVAIAGENFVIIGADTRLSVQNEFRICSRNQNKLFRLSDQSVLGIMGCWADCATLAQMMELQMRMYKGENNRTMSTPALAQMLSVTLYYKRFFPYYVQSIVAGLDEAGKGCVYSYDCIGHCHRSTFDVAGSTEIVLPFLDNQVGLLNMQNVKAKLLSEEKALSLLKDAFICAAERDPCTGDSLKIMTMTAGAVCEETLALRKD